MATNSQFVSAYTIANVGVILHYHYRGIQKTNSASTSAGLGFEQGAFSLET